MKFKFILFVTLFIVSLSSTSHAQDACEDMELLERNPDLQEECDENAKLEIRKARLDLEREISAKQQPIVPTPTDASKPPAGKTEAEGVEFPSEILAYKALNNISKSLKETIKINYENTSSLIIADQTVLDAISVYRNYQTEESFLIAQYKEELEIGTEEFANLSALALPTNVIRNVVDLLALFRKDTKIQGFEISDIPEKSIAAQLSNELKSDEDTKDISVFYPSLYPPITFSGKQNIYKSVRQLYFLKTKADAKIKELSARDNTSNNEKSKLVRLKALNDQFAVFIKFLEDNAINIAKAAEIAEILDNPGKPGRLLYVDILKAGGSFKTTQNILGSNLRHAGGVIVNYKFFDDQGAIENSDVIYYDSGYMKFEERETNINPAYLGE